MRCTAAGFAPAIRRLAVPWRRSWKRIGRTTGFGHSLRPSLGQRRKTGSEAFSTCPQPSRSSIRLGQLTREVGGQPAILKELGYATNDGWKNVFGLMGYGYLVAQERLGKELLKVPRHDVSPVSEAFHSAVRVLLGAGASGWKTPGKNPASACASFRSFTGPVIWRAFGTRRRTSPVAPRRSQRVYPRAEMPRRCTAS